VGWQPSKSAFPIHWVAQSGRPPWRATRLAEAAEARARIGRKGPARQEPEGKEPRRKGGKRRETETKRRVKKKRRKKDESQEEGRCGVKMKKVREN